MPVKYDNLSVLPDHNFQYQAASWKKSRRLVAEVVSHGRYVTFQMAEVLVSKRLFWKIL